MNTPSDNPPRCPYCGTPLEVAGHTTHYYWCPACSKAVDPAPTPPTAREVEAVIARVRAAWLKRRGG